MKKIKFNIKKLQKQNKNFNWQRAVFGAVAISALIFGIACAYLMIKPVDNNIKAIIDEEISAVDVIFDQKIIEEIEERQIPTEKKEPSSGKNPFTPF